MADLIVGNSSDPEVLAARDRVAARREVEHEDRADVAATALGEDVLRQEMGVADFETGRRAVQTYLRGLTAAELQQIGKDLKADGSSLATPDQMRKLAKLAIGELPTAPAEIKAELEASRERMRKDLRGWHADDRAQLRYRLLLRAAAGQE